MPVSHLSKHLSGRTGLTETCLDVGGREFVLTHPEQAYALLDEEEFARDERLPYWADLWPSAIALGRHVAGLDLPGLRVIELGCGLGLPGIVALSCGAREVVAADHYEAALDFAAHNALSNTGQTLNTILLDWHKPDVDYLGSFDLVLAADVFYEARNVPALASLVPDLLSPQGTVLLADPRRKHASEFLKIMKTREFEVFPEETAVSGFGPEIRVALYRIGRR